MKTNGIKLRNLVIDNRFENGRITADQVGKEDYKELTGLYRNALDAMTNWAKADYVHKSEKQDEDKAFAATKAILALYATDDSRIVIDAASMRTLRDLAVKPQREYSKAYKDAKKAEKQAKAIVESNYAKLVELGCTMPTDGQDLEEWKAKALIEGKYKFEGIDMLTLYIGSLANLATATAKVEAVKKAGKWSWRRPAPVSESVFADLVENYIGDCLEDDYNIKSSKNVRDEKAEARKLAKEAKANS